MNKESKIIKEIRAIRDEAYESVKELSVKDGLKKVVRESKTAVQSILNEIKNKQAA